MSRTRRKVANLRGDFHRVLFGIGFGENAGFFGVCRGGERGRAGGLVRGVGVSDVAGAVFGEVGAGNAIYASGGAGGGGDAESRLNGVS